MKKFLKNMSFYHSFQWIRIKKNSIPYNTSLSVLTWRGARRHQSTRIRRRGWSPLSSASVPPPPNSTWTRQTSRKTVRYQERKELRKKNHKKALFLALVWSTVYPEPKFWELESKKSGRKKTQKGIQESVVSYSWVLYWFPRITRK